VVPQEVEAATNPLASSVVEFCNQNPRGYILLEGDRGVGKSLLLDGLNAFIRELDLVLLRCPARACAALDCHTQVEHLNEWLRSRVPDEFQVLELSVLRDLSWRHPGPAERLIAYLGALSLLNQVGLILCLENLDELSEVQARTWTLGGELPHGVYQLLSYARSQLAQPLVGQLEALAREGLRLQLQSGSPALETYCQHWLSRHCPESLHSPLTRRAGGQPGALVYLAAAAELFGGVEQLPACDQAREDWFFAPYLNRISELHRPLHLLAACHHPIELAELSLLEVDRASVDRLIASCPPLYSAEDAAVTLADEGFRQFLRRQPSYPSACRELCEHLVRQLADRAGDATVSDFVRLYSTALDSKERALLDQVARLRPLNDKRLALFARLELQGRFHQKVEVLCWWRACLARAAEQGDISVRDELAWAHSSRGLTYLSLGLAERGLQDIDEAVRWFELLVQREGQSHLANGLAGALNRRSEALRQLSRAAEAMEEANRAIDLYARVSDRDVGAVLALAHQNRALIHRSQGMLAEAEKDIARATELFTPRAHLPRLRRELATAWHTRASLQLARQDCQAAVESSTRGITLLLELVHEHQMEVVNELAGAYNNRGAAHYRLSQFEDAMVDYTESIKLRSELVSRGRLELRNDLASTCVNRALVSQAIMKLTDALADFERAISIRTQLVEGENRLDLAGELAQTHIYRGQALRSQNRMLEAQEDYQRAIDVYTSQSGEPRSRELSQAYSGLALVQLDQEQFEQALESCNRALEMLADPKVFADRAVALNNRGEAYRHLKQYGEARRDFEEALGIYHEMVQSAPQQPMRELAITRQNLARVKLAQGELAGAVEDSTRALEIVLILLEEQGRAEVLPHLVAGYNTRGMARIRLEQLELGLKDLGRAIDLYKFLIEDREQSIFLDDLGEVYHERGQALLKLGRSSYDSPDRLYFPKQALDDYNRALQCFEMAPASEEVRAASARTRVARSRLQEDLGDFSAALLDASQAIDYYQGRGPSQMSEFLGALTRRAEIYLRAGQYELALHDYLRICDACRDSHDLRCELAEATNNVAWTRTCLGQYQEAFEDYKKALALYRQLVLQEKRLDVGRNLAWTYNNRAATHNIAGNPKAALEDYSHAVDIYTFLVEEGGQPELRARLATTLNNRGLLYQGMAVMDQAVRDFTRALDVRAAAARTQPSPEMLVELASAYSTRGLTYHKDGKTAYALADYRAAAEILTDLVEKHRRLDLGNELARCLLAQGVLGPDPTQDPEARKALSKAIQVVTSTLKAGFTVTTSFPLHFVKVVSKIAETEAYLLGGLPEGVLNLSEALLQSKVPSADPLAYGELLLGLSSRLAADKSSKSRIPLAILAACFLRLGVEKSQQGSLAKLIHALLELGQGLASGAALPELGLGRVGACFGAVGEALKTTLLSADARRELEQLSRSWQELPPSLLAQTEVSRPTLQGLVQSI
jgi:tetratricopeptide (TPR) repeat protein